MSLVKRSTLNLVRSPARTLIVVAMLAISLGLGLSMFEVHSITSTQLGAISGKIGTDIFVSPAGFAGPFNGNVTLDLADAAKIKNLPHVMSVQSSLKVAYSGNTAINIASPTYPDTGPVKVSPVQDLSLMGLEPAVANPILRLRGGDATMTIVEGTYFNSENTDPDVMVVGQALAQVNNFQVGSTVDVIGTPVQVIGIYSTGQTDNMMIMPIATVQRLYNIPGVNGVTVVADKVSNVDTVVRQIETLFTDKPDVFTATSEYNRINPNIIAASNASLTGMVVTFIVAAAVILLAVFLVMRQRVREIGILKAVGASNWRIELRFGIETLMVCLLSSVIAIFLAFIFVNKITNAVADARISPMAFLVAVGAAVALALLASVIPIWFITRVRPAEVLRNE
jgi:putative ABC transport system permease protein